MSTYVSSSLQGWHNDKLPLGSDQTLGDALDTAEGKLVVARQICKQYCPLALVPWSATLPGCRRRILQLWLDLLLAYERGLLLEGSFADISVKKAGISRQLIEKYKQDCVNRAEFFFGLRGDWWPPICELVDIRSGSSDNVQQVDFDGEIFGKALKKQAPAPAQAAAPAASSQEPPMQSPIDPKLNIRGQPCEAGYFLDDEPAPFGTTAKSKPRQEQPRKRKAAAAWPASTGEVQKESGVN